MHSTLTTLHPPHGTEAGLVTMRADEDSWDGPQFTREISAYAGTLEPPCDDLKVFVALNGDGKLVTATILSFSLYHLTQTDSSTDGAERSPHTKPASVDTSADPMPTRRPERDSFCNQPGSRHSRA